MRLYTKPQFDINNRIILQQQAAAALAASAATSSQPTQPHPNRRIDYNLKVFGSFVYDTLKRTCERQEWRQSRLCGDRK